MDGKLSMRQRIARANAQAMGPQKVFFDKCPFSRKDLWSKPLLSDLSHIPAGTCIVLET